MLMIGYISEDAPRRNMGKWLWILLCIVLQGGIGPVLYFLLRQPVLSQCPCCGTKVDSNINYCPQCAYRCLSKLRHMPRKRPRHRPSLHSLRTRSSRRQHARASHRLTAPERVFIAFTRVIFLFEFSERRQFSAIVAVAQNTFL